METSCTLETAQGMIEYFGDRAATQALVLASDATMLGDLGSIVLWLEVAEQIRSLSKLDGFGTRPQPRAAQGEEASRSLHS